MNVVAAQPYDFEFDPASTALIVIDMQRDFVEPGGFGEALGNKVETLAGIVPTVAALLDWARALGLHVIHTRESHAPDLSDCPPAKRRRGAAALRIGDPGPMGRILIRGEPGNAILDAVAPQPGEIVIDKPGKGAFYATPLGELLPVLGVRTLIFAGVTTEVCVQTSMREANDRGYDCLLVEDATASYFPEFKRATLEMIRAQGAIVGWTAPLSALHAAAPPSVFNLQQPALNLPQVVAEVKAVFAAYEDALLRHDVAALDDFFLDSALIVRYGVGDAQHGIAELRGWRASCMPVSPSRTLCRTVITTVGYGTATASTEFTDASGAFLGRQQQTWVKMGEAWRIVAAHVSHIAP